MTKETNDPNSSEINIKLDYLVKANEERHSNYKRDRKEILDKLDKNAELIEENQSDIAAIKVSLSKQKGFVAGVIFVISGIWGALTVFKAAIVKYFVGGA